MINPMKAAKDAKLTSKMVARGKSVGSYAMAHKGRSIVAGSAALGGIGYMGRGRSGRGVDKMPGGRPTGIYKY